jgi:hypothetical protein
MMRSREFPGSVEGPHDGKSAETRFLKPNEVSSGTTIMAIPFEGGVVLGADSRVSTGTYIANRVSDKIAQLHERIWCCRSGSAADTQALTDYVKHFLSQLSIETGKLPTVKTAAHLMRKLCYENKDNLMAGVIVGGWDPVEGGSVYNIPLGATEERCERTLLFGVAAAALTQHLLVSLESIVHRQFTLTYQFIILTPCCCAVDEVSVGMAGVSGLSGNVFAFA